MADTKFRAGDIVENIFAGKSNPNKYCIRKRRLLKACGHKCDTCPFLKSHWDGLHFLGLSCLKGAW